MKQSESYSGPKSSEYWTVDVEDPKVPAMRTLLSDAFDEIMVVKK